MSHSYEVRWLVGCPQSGKTTQAIHEAMKVADARGVPAIFVDSGGVRQFEHLPEYSIGELCEAVWKTPRERVVRFRPHSEEDVAALGRAVMAGKDVVLVIDEAAFWLSSATSSGSELLRLLRSTQHSRSDVFLTTQHLSGDVPPAAISCSSEILCFRCQSPRVLEVLRRDYDQDPAQIRALERCQFVRVRTGFESESKGIR